MPGGHGACAVLTGIGTVLADNPVLNVREVPTPRQPQLVVVDETICRHRLDSLSYLAALVPSTLQAAFDR